MRETIFKELIKSLVKDSLSLLVYTKSHALIFLLKKKVRSFYIAKSLHIFSSKMVVFLDRICLKKICLGY